MCKEAACIPTLISLFCLDISSFHPHQMDLLSIYPYNAHGLTNQLSSPSHPHLPQIALSRWMVRGYALADPRGAQHLNLHCHSTLWADQHALRYINTTVDHSSSKSTFLAQEHGGLSTDACRSNARDLLQSILHMISDRADAGHGVLFSLASRRPPVPPAATNYLAQYTTIL